jgi:hypothetical protein
MRGMTENHEAACRWLYRKRSISQRMVWAWAEKLVARDFAAERGA